MKNVVVVVVVVTIVVVVATKVHRVSNTTCALFERLL